jgi:transcriptional regulator with XRE-family HTH domain
MNEPSNEQTRAEALGAYLKSVRTGLNMSLRDVEEATDKQVSNAYLSQMENGKIVKPSPHILYALSGTYSIAYEKVMERAGYIPPTPAVTGKAAKHGKLATCSIEHLTADEEKALLTYLDFWRGTKKREKSR